MKIILPRVYKLNQRHEMGLIRQVARLEATVDGTVADYRTPGTKGKIILPADSGAEILILEKHLPAASYTHLRIVRATRTQLAASNGEIDLRLCEWLAHPESSSSTQKRRSSREKSADALRSIMESWSGAFKYVEEDESVGIKGLRPPQIGAVHAIHAHWTVSAETATIVMPTGTGKTETMIALLVSTPCPKVLVIVPTDALRSQLTDKFLTFGILRSFDGVLDNGAQFPIVGALFKRPTKRSDLDSFFEQCNVVVTTSQIAGQCPTSLQERMAHHCPFLFVDEAHHAEAPTWQSFKQKFRTRRVVQFTATPFREDGKPLDGRIVYKYPLRKAQTEGYFKTILFDAVEEFDPARADEAIAERAIHHLRTDTTGKHIVMARVANVPRAERVIAIYEKFSEYRPVQLHTGITSKSARENARELITTGRSRIVVCIDMLGEGFDLPELKIAAFHDIRKSLAVTLQLAGRFTRSRADLGNPVFIANTADVNVRDELRKLYTRDPDWNSLLPEFSEAAIEEQISLKEFVDGFAHFPEDMPIQRIRPATSAVVYKTRCADWRPQDFRHGIAGIDRYERVHSDVNDARRTLIIVTARKEPVVWAHNDQIYDWVWELLVVFWDDSRHLLFINSSSNEGLFKALASAVAGPDVELVNENAVFRTFAGVNRLTLQNVGLTEQLGRLIRYTGRMGPDVGPGLSEAQKQNTRRTVLSGRGFESGSRVTVGASRKGRIWSMRRANLEQLIDWCMHIGAKVLDESIDPAEVLKGTLESTPISEFPTNPAIAIDWPEAVYAEPETAFEFTVDGVWTWNVGECELVLVDDGQEATRLSFSLQSHDDTVLLTLDIYEQNGTKDYRFAVESGRSVMVRAGAARVSLEEFFYEDPPMIWFADGASLEGNTYTPLKANYPPYPRQKIKDWNWSGVDLRVESQGLEKRTDSIQYRVIQRLKSGSYDIVFDDDGPGEAADVVSVKIETTGRDRAINVEFYHCKYSRQEPGRRIKDLYEVCGQAQKSVHWMSSDEKRTDLFTHLLRRDAKRRSRHQNSRIEVGDAAKLRTIREMSRTLPVKLSIFAVQPGLSRAAASMEQLELISVTESYLLETYQLPFILIASK